MCVLMSSWGHDMSIIMVAVTKQETGLCGQAVPLTTNVMLSVALYACSKDDFGS